MSPTIKQERQKKPAHWPTLNTVIMVEDTLRKIQLMESGKFARTSGDATSDPGIPSG